MLGIEYPIIQTGMGWVATPELVAACSGAGAIGFLAAATIPPDEVGAAICKAGKEFGTTTGRPRRAGWFDAVAVRYALELCGATGWIVTKLDVLDAVDEIRVGVAYRVGDQRFTEYPAHLPSVEGVEVEYETYPGWSDDLSGARVWEDLPDIVRTYVDELERLVGVPIVMISVGPERDAVIERRI